MKTKAPPQVIRADEVYQLDEFLRRAGIGRWAYRTALRNGLRVIRTAGRVYVRGSDWFAYLDAQGGTEAVP
jgi:hypothetical protein